MVEEVISTIAKVTTTEFVLKKMDMLTYTQSCSRRSQENPAQFVNRFNGSIELSVQFGELYMDMDRQFKVLMLQNANLSTDTPNALTLKLMMVASSDQKKDGTLYLSTLLLLKAVSALQGDESSEQERVP